MLRTLLIVLALPAFAQDPARFLIERIEVRNARRVSPDLVISESLLRTGMEYSEDELSAAAARLGRLPYLVSADFALEKGSERGRHVLVINITETKPFFFLVDSRSIITKDHGLTRIEYADDAGGESKDAALGFRWFTGRRGILHVGVMSRNDRHVFTTGYSAVAAGYTQYDLFGTRAFATVNVRLPFGRWAEGTISPQIVTGIPLTTTQTLTLEFEDTHFRRDTREILGSEFERQDAERLLSMTWSYNTTNHPFAPTRGTIVRVAPLRSMRDRSSFRFFVPGGPPEELAEHINGYGLDVLASRYWELSDRNAVSAGAVVGWATVEDRINARANSSEFHWRPAYQVLRGGYSRNLWRQPRDGDSRLELEGRYVRRQYNRDHTNDSVPDREAGLQVSTSWVRRSAWGSLRLGVGYGWGF
jgi:outer membrane protein assembly factor BamA